MPTIRSLVVTANALLDMNLANSLLQKLLPEYAAAATALKEEEENGGAKVILAKVNSAKARLSTDISSDPCTKVSSRLASIAILGLSC